MKRTLGIIALTLGLSVAAAPACCMTTPNTIINVSKIEQSYTVPNQEWLRLTNAAAGPYTDVGDTKSAKESERTLRTYIRQTWRDAVIVDVAIAVTPQAPIVVAEALDALLPLHPKKMLQREGASMLAVVVDPEDERIAWLVLLILLEEDNGTAIHIVEMRHEPREEKG